MNDEIKEIDITKGFYLCSPLLNTECMKKNCYINDGPCCHTGNKEYSQQHLLDYITNLQRAFENSYTEEQLDFAVNEVKEQLKIEKQYTNQLCNKIDELRVKNYDLQQENEKSKERIDKAIEYIQKYTRWFDSEYASIYGKLCSCQGANSNRLEVMVNPSNLLKILKGDDEYEKR